MMWQPLYSFSFSQNRTDPLTGTEVMAKRAPTPLTRTVMVQTDYRDSETQTDPYSPEYVIQPGSQPELLTLATLAYGKFRNIFVTFLCFYSSVNLSKNLYLHTCTF